MILKLVEDTKENISVNENNIILSLTDFNLLLEDFFQEKLVLLILENNQIIKMIKLPEEFKQTLANFIINDKSISELEDYLTTNNFPLYSLYIQVLSTTKRKYQVLSSIRYLSKIEIICGTSNLISALNIAKKYKLPTTIYAPDIPLTEYKNLLSNYDLNLIEDLNIQIYYQEHNSSLSPLELYNLSNAVSLITDEIKRYNLSPLEQVFYVYDRVKSRIYKETEGNARLSRDVDKVLKGDSIVCVGYSNLFNAVLKSLSIRAEAILDLNKKHQRSMVYIKDNKYKIDGVFAFDSTWDSRKETDNNSYIDKYNYFAMSLEESERTIDNNLFDILNFPLAKMIELSGNSSILKKIEFQDKLSTLFKLAGNPDEKYFIENLYMYSYLRDQDRDKTKSIYRELVSKYLRSNLSEEIFMMALYNARRIEYYKGLVDSLNIDDIYTSTRERYFRRKVNDLICREKRDLLEEMFILLDYEDELDRKLGRTRGIINESLPAGNTTRDRENIKLLKVLRRVRKKLSII